MAGRGSRFQVVADQNPEYKKPKPLILIHNKPMVRWAIESLPFVDLPGRPAHTKFKVTSSDLIFICQQQHQEEYQVTEKLKEIFGQDAHVVLIPEVTRGAVETVLAAKSLISPDEEVVISDSDHFFSGDELYKTIVEKDEQTDGVIPVFKPRDAEVKWSYSLFGDDHVITAVGEKDAKLAAQGAYANIGAYYFSKGEILISEAESMVNSNEMYGPSGKQEFYVAPLYQRLISKGMKIKAAIIPQVWGLGTPNDLEYFLANYKHD